MFLIDFDFKIEINCGMEIMIINDDVRILKIKLIIVNVDIIFFSYIIKIG